MSRDIDSGFASALAAGGVQVVHLAELDFDSGTLYMWTGYGNLPWNGNNYIGVGNLSGLSAVNETQDMQAQGMTMQLNGVPSDLVALAFEEEYQSRPCRLYLAAFNPAGDNGSPVNYITGYYRYFSGLMDVMQINDDGNNCSITLTAESVLFLLTRNKKRDYTSEDQKSDFDSDTGFDFIAPLQDKQVVW